MAQQDDPHSAVNQTTAREPQIFTSSEMMKEMWMAALIGFGVGAPVWICVGINLVRLVNGR